MDPVLHLVRNAVSHGIEAPDERIAAGKRPEGTITLSAVGGGRARHASRSPTTAAALTRRPWSARASAWACRCRHGPLDARGAAHAALLAWLLDAATTPTGPADAAWAWRSSRTTVEQLSGTLALETDAGHGTRFTIELPLTLAITDALIGRVGGRIVRRPAERGARGDRRRRRPMSCASRATRSSRIADGVAADRPAGAAVRYRREPRGALARLRHRHGRGRRRPGRRSHRRPARDRRAGDCATRWSRSKGSPARPIWATAAWC